MNLRVLFIGENWHGSNATSYKRAFRHLGCDVLDIDDYHFLPRWNSVYLRILLRLLRRGIVSEFGKHITRQARDFSPDLAFVFKGVMVKPAVIRALNDAGIVTFNFYPDGEFDRWYRMFGNDFATCIPEYRCCFTPKSFHMDRYRKAGARRLDFMPYAYDPWCHFPVALAGEEARLFSSDVAFIGTWGPEMEACLSDLVRGDFPWRLSIWGRYWERVAPNSPLAPYIQGKPAIGMTQAKVFAGTKVALGLVRPPDLHTARSFEIPAYGAFMLAQRTSDHSQFFEEGREIECFGNADELREKIDYYCMHHDERTAIAKAGYEKVTKGGHSYVDRARRVLEAYEELAGSQP